MKPQKLLILEENQMNHLEVYVQLEVLEVYQNVTKNFLLPQKCEEKRF